MHEVHGEVCLLTWLPLVINYIGYNSRCGVSFVCNYSCIDYLIGWLIGEIKERSVYVPGYDYSTFELYGLWCLKLLTSLILLFCLVHIYTYLRCELYKF